MFRYSIFLLTLLYSAFSFSNLWISYGNQQVIGTDPYSVIEKSCVINGPAYVPYIPGATMHPDGLHGYTQQENTASAVCRVGVEKGWNYDKDEPGFYGRAETFRAKRIACEDGASLERDERGVFVCRKYCPAGTVGVDCAPEPEAKNECTKSKHPIDFFKGRKYRNEPILSAGGNHPIDVEFYYNNHANRVFTSAGLRATSRATTVGSSSSSSTRKRRVAVEYSPKPADYEFRHALRTSHGFEATTRPRYTGQLHQYWRHSYSDFLNTAYGKYDEAYLYWADGEVSFKAARQAYNHPTIKWSGSKTARVQTPNGRVTYTFDDEGRLIRKDFPGNVSHILEYDGIDLTRISHTDGTVVNLEYTDKHQISRVTSGQKSVEIDWSYLKLGSVLKPHESEFGIAPRSSSEMPVISELRYYNGEDELIKTRRFEYNDPDWAASITHIYDTDHLSNEIEKQYAEFRYNEAGQAIYSSLEGGIDAVSVDYLSSDKRVVINSLGRETTYEFASIHGVRRLKSITGAPSPNCQLQNTTFSYYESGHKKEVNRDGIVTKYPDGNSGTIIQAVGTDAETRVDETYNYLNQITSRKHKNFTENFTYRNEKIWRYYLTAPGWDTASGFDGNNTQIRNWTYSYNSIGKVSSVNGPRSTANDQTKYEYTENGHLARQIFANGHAIQYQNHDVNGNPRRVIDVNGHQWDLSFNHNQQLTQRSLVQNGLAVTTYRYEYDADGNLIKVQLPKGEVLTMSYDVAGRLIGMQNRTGDSVTYERDQMGNIVNMKVESSEGLIQQQLTQAFDEAGRRYSKTTGEGHSYQFHNNVHNQVASIEDPLLQIDQHSFDALDRLIEHRDALDGVTKYEYDAAGNLTSVTDPENKVTRYEHNAFGEVTRRISPDTGITQYEYDRAGNRTKTINDLGEETSYQYDALNRLVKVSYHDATSTENRYDLPSHRNSIGRLSQVVDRNGNTTLYHYDALGNVTEKQYSLDDTSVETKSTVQWQYDPSTNQLQTLTYPDGSQLHYEYDQTGQLVALDWQAVNDSRTNIINDIEYQAFAGAIDKLTFGNGLTLTREFNLNGQMTGYDLKQNTTLTRDALNRITAIEKATPQWFEYDALDRLVFADQYNLNQSFGYDKIGNRLSLVTEGNTGMSKVDMQYNYDEASHHLDSVTNLEGSAPTKTFNINSLGQTIEYRDGDVTYTLIYDPTGHIKEIKNTEEANSVVATYQYDANQLRIKKQVGNETTYYDYDLDGKLLSERNQDNQVIRHYIWLHNELVAYVDGGQLYYVHNDHLQTPIALINQDQETVWTIQHRAFGEGAVNEDPDRDGQTITFNLRFPGQYYDAESGLHYNWHRYYDPSLGRYLQSDPIGLRGGLNTFGYVGANPVINVDPHGLVSLTVGGSMNSTPGKGAGGGGGVYISSGGDSGQGGYGVYGMNSTTTGFNAGAGISIDVLSGGTETLSGRSTTDSVCFLVVCGNRHQNEEGETIGWGVVLGPGLPGGFVHSENTTIIGGRDFGENKGCK